MNELMPTLIMFCRRRLVSVNSSMLNPEMKDRYPGINGKTQGETKDRKPANRAPIVVTETPKSMAHLVICEGRDDSAETHGRPDLVIF